MPVPIKPELGVCVICDIRGCSVSAFWAASKIISNMIDIDKPNYFGSMDRMLIINAPWAFAIAWNFVSPLLDSVTRERIQVVKGDAYRGLLKFIDDDVRTSSSNTSVLCVFVGLVL